MYSKVKSYKRAIGILALAVSLLLTSQSQISMAEESSNFNCFQVDDHNRRLGAVTIECFLDYAWDEDGIATNLEISSDGKRWKYVEPISKHVGGDSGPCMKNYQEIFPARENSEYCYYIDLSYEPTKIGNIYLRAESEIAGNLFSSNTVQFDVRIQTLNEQIENGKRDALNKYYKLRVNWPERFQVGTTKQLKVTSPEKYSGRCSILSRPGGQVEFLYFDMRKGLGAVKLRGLKRGAVVVEIGCYQNNGGGPYANSKYTVYFY